MKKPIARLHNWYISKINIRDGKECFIANGNVTGHYRLCDTKFIHTSKVDNIHIDSEAEEVVIETLNTIYYCRLSECKYFKGETYEALPELKEYAKKYEQQKKEYDVDDNSILIVLSDHMEYYFETAMAKANGKRYEGNMSPHIGMFQDSCLIRFRDFSIDNENKYIDIRYFPHIGNLENYSWETAGLDVYLENTGESQIYFSTPVGIIELEAGERKKVCEENALPEENNPILHRGDLYPAVFLVDDSLFED